MEYPHTVNVLEQCQVSPPPGSVPQTSLPLTIFDLPLLGLIPPQKLFFYELEVPKTHFMDSILPNMKHSLSLTLQHFFPFVGNIVWSPQSTKPEIIYVDGDSISFNVAESNFNFKHLCGNYPRDVNEFTPLVTPLLPLSTAPRPLLAFQVTLFPNSGISIGYSFCHVVADGMAGTHFMRAWSSVCSLLGGDPSLLSHPLPHLDRTTINDPYGIEASTLNELKNINITQQSFSLPCTPTDPSNKVVATFIMDLPKVEKLKKWVLTQIIEKHKKEPSFYVTTLVVTCAYVWVCLVKALEGIHPLNNVREHFMLPINARTRIDPALPVTYFGNCLLFSFTSTQQTDLLGEDGLVLAAEAIAKANPRDVNEVLNDVGNYIFNLSSAESERLLIISGSPKLRSYDVNFGFGKPKKIEIISSTSAGFVTLMERGDSAEGGLEIGIALGKLEMDAFASLFEDTLKEEKYLARDGEPNISSYVLP
ncbi:hypothetical protein GIB67_027937 [Kingdonia uniflora]|uniref:Uncharacterized protein n=1 Tax=Kingdonia uniflora TaxID=39325 RepID=A0A7J7LGU0_9MAGN|nr:hypothetical protein GIB67_027937 [Kingdonia uniflora]